MIVDAAQGVNHKEGSKWEIIGEFFEKEPVFAFRRGRNKYAKKVTRSRMEVRVDVVLRACRLT